jgi:hypothetical protein
MTLAGFSFAQPGNDRANMERGQAVLSHFVAQTLAGQVQLMMFLAAR